jgi:Domain of unknown function (DUF4190)
MSYSPEPPQPGHGQPYGSSYDPPHVTPTNGKATASLVTGVASLVLAWCPGLGLLGVVAIYLGVRARNEVRGSGGTQQGDGLALGGMVTGAVAVGLGLLLLALIVIAIATGTHFEATSGRTARL